MQDKLGSLMMLGADATVRAVVTSVGLVCGVLEHQSSRYKSQTQNEQNEASRNIDKYHTKGCCLVEVRLSSKRKIGKDEASKTHTRTKQGPTVNRDPELPGKEKKKEKKKWFSLKCDIVLFQFLVINDDTFISLLLT